MGNANYIAGAAAEREFIKLAEATGRFVGVRSAGSHGPFDGVLICVNSLVDLSTPTPRGILETETRTIVFQMKRYTKTREKKTNEFADLPTNSDKVVKLWINRKKGIREFEIEVVPSGIPV